ncbi:MAG TPA: CoA-binding protein [Pseudonocardiaceae bacterium]|nr:CoA-binding protein [Pseudonocardiaceae bacterium]
MSADLGPLLRPASVAVIGASADATVISGLPQRLLAQHGYAGAVYPVNPRYTDIDGVRCWPDIGAVPGPVDVALIVVNAERVTAVVRECGKAGVRFVVIISSGFAEQFDGAERDNGLRTVCAEYPAMRVIGPNAEGLMNVVDRVPLGFSPTINYQRGLRTLLAGDVAVISQSGGLGFALFNDGLARGLGFSHVISTGNELDLDVADLAEYLLDDPATRILLLFVEGLDQPGRLGAIAAGATALGKRVVLAKVGVSAAGSRAALAHTAHHTGDEAWFARLIAEHGVLRARDQEEMVDFALALSRTRQPTGRRIGIMTTSGGAGTWLADDVVAAGLDLPVLSTELQARLRTLIPAFGSPANPVDATAQVLGRGGLAPLLRLVADSGEVDALVQVATLADTHQLEREGAALAEVAADIPLVIYSYTRPAQASVDLLAELGIAYFTSGRRVAGALAALVPRKQIRHSQPRDGHNLA